MRTRYRLKWLRMAAGAGLVATAAFLQGCGGVVTGDMVSYDLPPESAEYRLELTARGATTEWTYHSDRPTEQDAPELQPCAAEFTGEADPGPCRPEPLIFLRYDLGLSLDNTAPAGQSHEIAVTGYYQARLSEPPEVTDVEVEASYDGGETWQPASTELADDGSATATIRHPADAEQVGLRVTAADDEGNSVVQTIPEAYRLS